MTPMLLTLMWRMILNSKIDIKIPYRSISVSKEKYHLLSKTKRLEQKMNVFSTMAKMKEIQPITYLTNMYMLFLTMEE